MSDEQMAAILKALSNRHRLRIFMRLAECCGPEGVCATDAGMACCVGELGEGLGVAPSTVSHHVKELRQAGLIKVTRHGKTVECRVVPEALAAVRDFFAVLAGPE